VAGRIASPIAGGAAGHKEDGEMGGMRDYERYGGSYGMDSRGRRSGGRLSLVASVFGVTFAVVLAAIVGQRLSDQAISVLAGAVCGVGASIPTSLLILSLVRRRQESRPEPPRQGGYPPVLVIQSPPAANGFTPHQPGYLPPYAQPMPREFTVVGGGDLDDTGYERYA